MGHNGFNALEETLIRDLSFLVINNTYMAARPSTLVFLKRLLENNYKVLGIEGFVWNDNDGSVIPDMGSIVDFNDVQPEPEKAIEILSTVLADGKANFFEFTIDDPRNSY